MLIPTPGAGGFDCAKHEIDSTKTNTPRNVCISSPYCGSKNVRIQAIVIAKLEFSNVQRQILVANLMECCDDAALNQRPKAFSRICMNCTKDIFAFAMVNNAVIVEVVAQRLVRTPCIRADQANFVGDGFADKANQRGAIDTSNYACNNVTFSLYSANNDRFAGADATTCATATSAIAIAAFIFCVCSSPCRPQTFRPPQLRPPIGENPRHS